MKVKTLLSSILLFGGLSTFLIISSSYSNGFGGEYQTSPNCQGCHTTDANTVVTIFGLNGLLGYTPGVIYPLTVTVSNSTKLGAGFQIQTNIGSFVNPSAGVVIAGSGLSAGHTGRSHFNVYGFGNI